MKNSGSNNRCKLLSAENREKLLKVLEKQQGKKAYSALNAHINTCIEIKRVHQK